MLPAQIYAVIALLVAFGVPQDTVNNVQSILEQRPAPITTSVPITVPMGVAVEPIAGSAAPSDVCVPNPVLNLATTTSNGGNTVAFIAQYSTGCPIPADYTYSYQLQTSNGKTINSGVSKTYYEESHAPLNLPDMVFNYVSLPINMPDTDNDWFSVSIGTTTEKIQAR